MSHTRRRFWWLPLLVVVSVLGTGCNGSDSSDAENELPFAPFEAPADMIPPLPGASSQVEWWDPLFIGGPCDVNRLDSPQYAWEPDASDTSGITSLADDDESERAVGFITMRWSDPSQFAKAERRMRRSMEYPCFTTRHDKRIYTEPVELDGLPDGYRAVRWPEDRNQITVLLFDADSQIAMVVAWEERHGSEYDVPIDQLVDVANRAWTEFLANNPPVG